MFAFPWIRKIRSSRTCTPRTPLFKTYGIGYFITEKDSRNRVDHISWIEMDKEKQRIWLEAILDRFKSKRMGNPESATAIFEESVGALQVQLKSGTIQPSKLGPHEKQDVYIDLAHIVERGTIEIGEAKQLLREGWAMEGIVEKFLPKTRVLRRVIAHYVESKQSKNLNSMVEEILTPTLNRKGDARGRPKTATYMRDYLASEYGVDHDTIKVWIGKGRRDAKDYAKDPEKMAAVFGLDLETLLNMSEEARESIVLGYSVGEIAVPTANVLTTNGPIGISDLSDQNN